MRPVYPRWRLLRRSRRADRSSPGRFHGGACLGPERAATAPDHRPAQGATSRRAKFCWCWTTSSTCVTAARPRRGPPGGRAEPEGAGDQPRQPESLRRAGVRGRSPSLCPPRTCWPIPSAYPQYEAVALFIERARAAEPAFRITSENARAVAEICIRLDGLPLAIELAASRVRLLEPAEILASFEERPPLLIMGRATFPNGSGRCAAQSSGATTSSMRHRGCCSVASPSSQAAAPWTLLNAICNPDGELGIDTLEAIAGLVDQSLVRRTANAGETRFGMLEIIREYGRERLEADGGTLPDRSSPHRVLQGSGPGRRTAPSRTRSGPLAGSLRAGARQYQGGPPPRG